MNTSRKAFTLIELLVTVAIFSLIASISYSLLSTSFKSKEIQNTHSDELFKLQNPINGMNECLIDKAFNAYHPTLHTLIGKINDNNLSLF